MRVYSYQTKEAPAGKSRGPKKFKNRWKKINWKKVFTWLFRLAAAGVFLGALLFLYYAKDLPDPNKLLQRDVPESTKIFARDNSLLYEVHGEVKRTQVNLDQISPSLKDATIAIEDKNFYKHSGISFTGIVRAALVDIVTGRKSQGASTITQQFVKNAILTNQKSWDRKIREAILAIAIDARFSKDNILKLYLNEIPYGRNAYGIEAASQSYFGKSAKDLDLAESAYLAALPQAPTYYNPLGPNRAALDARKNLVLAQMKEQGYIDETQEKQAKEEQVAFQPIKSTMLAPHFVLMVQDYLANKYGEKTLEEGGLKVYTTLDPKLQQIAEQVVKDDVNKESKKYNVNNAALVAIDPKTGQILAMVGSKDYFGDSEPAGCIPGKTCTFEPMFNAALSERQPGSSFKPYVYATAFDSDFKYSPASMLIDVTTDFGTFGGKDYIPHNFNGSSYGAVSMRQALAGSLNVPAVKTLSLVGVENAVQTAHNLGITSPLQNCGLSLVLGGCEVNLLDHVAAYSTIANGGVKNEKTPILKVEDKDGNILEQYQNNPKQVLDPQADYELINVMSDNDARSFVFGSHSPLILPDRTVAAKTGTTQDFKDGWTVGFTPSLAAGVWTGNNNGDLLKAGADGVVVAAPIWHDFMQQALAGTPAETFPVPDGIEQVTVDAVSGLLPTDQTPSTKTEVFASYSAPAQYDNVHVKVAMDSQTGLPATSLTPPGQITYQTYTVFHSERRNNPNWENPVIAWAQAHGYAYPPSELADNSNGQGNPNPNGQGPELTILEPSEGSIVSQLPLRVSVSAVSANFMSRVDLYMDGQFVQSISSEPYVFNLDTPYRDGQHTIAVKGVDSAGTVSDTSVNVTYSLATPISMVEPSAQTLASFPLTLTAESANSYGQINFYYQNSSGLSKEIGPADEISRLNGKFQYTLGWNGPLPRGDYKIYAQTDTGKITPKIKISVP
ncbi:MAG: penicillin-binding protein [Patescibacteria group bacterium]|nr:penicillin-binding protein [Patescibacteria group bacterium]